MAVEPPDHPMTRRAIPAGAIGLALATLAFAVSLWWGVERLSRQDEIAYSSTSTGGWLVVQAQVEHLRFLEALAAHAVAPDTDGRDRVQLRFDILISRMLPFHAGHEATEVRAMPDVINVVGRLEATLHELDPLVARMMPGDDAAAAIAIAIRDRLAPFAAELNNLTRLVVVERTGAIVQGRIRDAAMWVMAPFIGILLSAAWLVILLARQIGTAERLRLSAQEAHERARASQEELVEAIDSISEGFKLFDKDDRLVLYNSRFCELYPLLLPHVRLGMTFHDMLNAAIESGQIVDGASRKSDRMARHRSPRGAFEAQLADGRWVRIAERRTPDGGMVSVRTDITHLRQREAQLTESQERLRTLLEGAPDAMIVVDDKGILVLVNRRAEELFGYGKTELLGRKVEQLIPNALRAAHIQHHKAHLNQPSYRVIGAGVREVNAMTKSGVEVPVEITLSPAVTTNGRMVIVSVCDISERRRTAETVWRQANYDLLTKLPNRRLLSDRLQRSVVQE
ncbi:MAG: PAS domain S-box protein, partial [Proteobacteria bacterium]|nr:PAS domain S-box protein [Pseudomonadota bacterium]